MASMQETVFETAIAIESRSLLFYRNAKSKVKDNKTRRIFELLAQEEADHLEAFCGLYQGSEDDLVSILGKNYMSINSDPFYCLLLDSVDGDTTEKEALRIALKEEQACIDSYTVFVDSIREPHIHAVFARILNETHKHYEMISEEYMRLMNMVGRTDQDTFVRE